MYRLNIKMVWLLVVFLSVFCGLFAQQRLIFTPKLHDQYRLNHTMNIREITELMDLDLDRFKDTFGIDRDNADLETRPLMYLNVSLDDIYQHYCLVKFGFNDFSTLEEVSLALKIPFGRFESSLDLGERNTLNRKRILRDINRGEPVDMLERKRIFDATVADFTGTLTLLGISAVFMALLFTIMIITGMVTFVQKQKDTKLAAVVTPIGKVLTHKPENLNTDAIIAVIATIHKHKMKSIADHQIMLTWRRASVNMWHASGKTALPTITYSFLRRKS